MKKINLKKIFCSISCFLLLTAVSAQEIQIFYVAPTTVMESAFGAGNVVGLIKVEEGVQVPVMTNYRYTRILPSNIAAFRGIVAPNMRDTYDSLTIASSKLRSKLNPILATTGTKISIIYVFLIDDRTNVPESTPFCTQENGGALIAWPCASNWKEGANYEARISVGEKAAQLDINQAGGFRRWEGTLLHEFSHTQMLTDVTGVNKWDNPSVRSPNGIEISYGGDDSHWWEELQADQQQPMDEGLANFYALEYNPPSATELEAFLNDNNPRFLLGSRSFLSGVTEMWNAPHRVLCSGPLPCVTPDGVRYSVKLNTNLTPATGGYELREYSWTNVPGKYVFYNEYMSEAFFYLFHLYAFRERDAAYAKLVSAINTLCNNPNQRHRYPAHVANMLANSMEAHARTPAGQQEQATNTLVSSMFAYALFDLITHFGMSDADLQREFRINFATTIPYTPQPLAFTNYWAVRAQVKQLVCPFLGGNNCAPGSTGAIDIHRAVRELKTFFSNPTRILR